MSVSSKNTQVQNGMAPASNLRQLASDESGQALALVALMMMLFLAMLGFVLDYGYGHVTQRRMQSAADTAAIAGASELAKGLGPIIAGQRVEQVLAANGADIALSTYTISGNEVTVTAGVSLSTFFLGAVGIDEFSVVSRARAAYGQQSRQEHLMPFAIEEDLWVPGQSVTLWGDSHGPGNFGWVRWQGQNPSNGTIVSNVTNPHHSDELVLGDVVSGHPGVQFNTVQNALNAQIGNIVTLLLYDPAEVANSGSNLEYTVRGFAHFRITGTHSQGSNSQIYGEFVEYVSLGGAVNTSSTIGSSGVVLLE